MADKTYDVVVVGAGTKSLATAMYLAKYAKLSVGVFEDRHEACAGWCSEAVQGGGFIFDQCSEVMCHYPMYFGPVWEDFPELRDYGMRFIPHPVGFGMVKEDGRSILVHSEEFDPDQKKTAESIAAFSKKDAETWLRLWELWKTKWQQAAYELLFNPPARTPQEDPIARLFANPKENGVDPHWLRLNPFRFCKELFDSEDFLALFSRTAEGGGYGLLEPGMGFFNMIATFIWTGGVAAARGGTHNNAHACVRVVTNNGGEIFYRKSVKKILIENGRAKGVLLEDGTEVEAKVAVVTGTHVYPLMFELVGPEYFDPIDVRRVKSLAAGTHTMYYVKLALKEPPILKGEDYDPNVKWAGYLLMGQGDLSEDGLRKHEEYRRLGGHIPKEFIQAAICDHSAVDFSRVPKGMASLTMDTSEKRAIYHKSHREFMNDYWHYFENVVDIYIRFNKNVTRDSIYGVGYTGPKYQEGASRGYWLGDGIALDPALDQMIPVRPTPALASGRMPVKGLYATGACFQQGAWAGVWNGYSLYKIMAEDLGLPKPWEDKGRVPETVDLCYKYLDRFRV
ncbi:MAG: NAD(P)/FAD-dependent oxidoreductase, partial [Syntrophales bacterium]|nr:NAD(P)/FAD-dependent oxidoreductase [Syntrophales bacterium]